MRGVHAPNVHRQMCAYTLVCVRGQTKTHSSTQGNTQQYTWEQRGVAPRLSLSCSLSFLRALSLLLSLSLALSLSRLLSLSLALSLFLSLSLSLTLSLPISLTRAHSRPRPLPRARACSLSPPSDALGHDQIP